MDIEQFYNKIELAKESLKDLDSKIESFKSILIASSINDPKDSQELNLTQIVVGSIVIWDNLEGQVVQLYKRQISKIIQDTPISIEGSIENPAILIKDVNGNEFLKLAKDVSLKIT